MDGQSKSDYIENVQPINNFSPLFRQLLVAINPVLLLTCAGITAGFSSILLPQLKESGSDVHITVEEESWIAAISVLPMAIGCILGGFIMEKYGRKFVLLYTCPILLAGWLVLGFAHNYALILLGRFITGFCAGYPAPCCMIYVGETSSPKYRGFLLAFLLSGLSIGMFITHLLGTFLPWHVTSLINSVFPIIAFIAILFVPESPSWLAGKMRSKEAQEAFLWCRGYSSSAKEEMTIMIEKQSQNNEKQFSVKDYINIIKTREFYMPFAIVNIYFVTTQLSGVNTIPFYSISIMEDTIGDKIDSYASMIILDVVRVINAVIASILTRQMGRRPLTMLSGIGTCISLLALACALHFSDNSIEFLSYLKLVLLISYISFITIGLLPLPWTMTGELFPPKLRGFGSGIASAISFCTYFIIVKTSPSMFLNLGTDGTFALFGVFALAGTIYLYFFLPETKDRTLEEIEENFKAKTDKNQNEHESKSQMV